jgi:hypothetical protein
MRAKSIARKLANNNNNNINNGNNDKDCDDNDKKKIVNAFLAARGKFLKYSFKTICFVDSVFTTRSILKQENCKN